MCGLFGFASTETHKGQDIRKAFITAGFPLISFDRGMESSGIALVKPGFHPIVHKKALWGGDFIQQFKTQKLLQDVNRFSIAIGHVRAATRGEVSDDNAHPFQYGNITLVHNGHIRNAFQLPNSEKSLSNVDSARVAYSMSTNGVRETIEEVEGPFCFIWWDSSDKTLNVARNTDRPLWIAYTKDENSMYWASEFTQLLHLLRNASLDEEVGVVYPESMFWYKYSLADLRVPEKVPFVKSQGWLTYSKGTAGGVTGGKDTGVVTTSTPTTMEVIKDEIKQTRLKESRQAGIPTSQKKIERAKQQLHKLGFKFQELIMCRPKLWTPYKNQITRGSALAHTVSGDNIVEIINTTSSNFTKMLEARVISVYCQNVRQTASGQRIIGVLSTKLAEFLERVEQRNTEGTKSTLEIPKEYTGPGGVLVSINRFKELCVKGCANCCEIIEPEEHKKVLWLNSSQPMCYNCQTPELLEGLGLAPTNSPSADRSEIESVLVH